MSRFGRRTFLASSAGVAAGAVAAGAAGGPAAPAADAERLREAASLGCVRRQRPPPGRSAPAGSRSTASSTRSGSTPTTARSPGRCRRRAAARRRPPPASWCGAPTRATPALVWDSGAVRPPGRPSSPTPARRSPPTPPTSGRCRPRGPPGDWGPVVRAGPLHHRAARRRLAGPVAARPAGSLAATRPRHLPAHRGHPAGRHPAPRHRLRLGRPHVPALRRRRAGRRLAELLVPRRAVRARRRPDRRPCRPGVQRHRRAAPLVRAGPGPARVGARPALPALALVRRRPPRRRRVRRHVARAPGRMAARRRSATPTAATSSSGWTGGPIPQGWSERRLRRQRVVAGRPSIGPAGTRAVHPRPTRSAPPSARRRCARSACTRWPAARSWPTSAPSTRRGRGSTFASGEAGRTVTMRVGLPARSRRAGLDAARHPGDQSLLLLHHAAGHADLRGVHLPRVPLPADRRPGPAARGRTRWWRSPGMPPCPTCRRRPSRRTTACSTRCGSSAPARASTAARSSSSTPRPGRRASSSGTPPTSPRRVMRAYGDQNMSWQGLRDVARGQARYWPDGQVNAVYPNGDGARDVRHLHRALPRVALALLRLDGRPRHGGAASTRR